MPDLARTADAIGTPHHSRFMVLSDKTLLFLANFVGEPDELLGDLAKHVDDPPPTPIANKIEVFVHASVDRRGRHVRS